MDSTDDFLQIGGHENTFELIGLNKIRKLTNQKEAEFYEALQKLDSLKSLLQFTPKYFSMLQFQSTGKNDFYVTLENVIEPFKKPNLLDLKLGKQLYDDDADEIKKQRMIEKASRTTSGSLGLRIAGMKYFDGETYDKEFGRQLSSQQFQAELLKFLKPLKAEILRNTEALISAIKLVEGKFISASVLIVYESDNPLKYTFKLIDFAHTSIGEGMGSHKDILESLAKLAEIISE